MNNVDDISFPTARSYIKPAIIRYVVSSCCRSILTSYQYRKTAFRLTTSDRESIPRFFFCIV